MSDAAIAEKSLTSVYEEWLASTIDADGVAMPHAFQRSVAGCLTVYALAVPPNQAYELLLSRWIEERPQELIFAFDRYAMPGQGTTLGDLMAGFHIVGVRPRPFVVEYQHQPRIVHSIDWSNAFWNSVLSREFAATMRNMGLI